MINFFRKIRKKLADDNQFFKYSRYAVGEILLVVIGILIALSINNWNDERKTRAIELDLLKELRSTTKGQFNLEFEQLKGNKRSLTACQVILNNLNQGHSYHDSLTTYFTEVFTNYIVLNKDNAYQKVKTHGMNFISDFELKDELMTIFEVNSKWLVELNERNVQFQNRIVYPELISLFESIGRRDLASFPINEPFTNKKISDSLDYVDPPFNTKPLDYEVLKSNERFKNILRTTINFRQQYILFMEIRNKRMLRLLSQLDDEIELKSIKN